MSTESLVKSSFVLTSRAFEQPAVNKAFENETAKTSAIQGYTSTVAQKTPLEKTKTAQSDTMRLQVFHWAKVRP